MQLPALHIFLAHVEKKNVMAKPEEKFVFFIKVVHNTD